MKTFAVISDHGRTDSLLLFGLILLIVAVSCGQCAPQRRPPPTTTTTTTRRPPSIGGGSIVGSNQWLDSDGGRTKFAHNCEFLNGNGVTEIGNKRSNGQQCSGICLANSRCTHFVHKANVCYMKRNANSMTAVTSQGATCGWVVGRSQQRP